MRYKDSWFLGPIICYAGGDGRVGLRTHLADEPDRDLYGCITPEEARSLGINLISAAKEAELYLEERKAQQEAA
jgi:hypothetical protein